MAAPSGTIWGSIAGSYGRIGIYTTTNSTNTETTVTVQVWFWSKYSVSDSLGNALYLDNLSSPGSATTDRGGTNISTTVATGEGWSTSNQALLTSKSYSWTHTRGTSASTRYIYAKLTGVDRVGATMYANTTVSIPALASYTISYDANGGSGVPDSQTKYYGKNLTISSTKPTRTGYSFQGWALTQGGSVYYTSGSTCGKNENLTLYAVWKANTYIVNYDANGGSDAPAKQTKTYGITLKLSSTIPTRTNYNFLGWATSASATKAIYAAGASYTTNSAVTLYAVWELAYVKPRITNLSIYRVIAETVEVDGTYVPSDTGTHALISFDWECDQTVSSITIELEPTSGDILTASPEVSGTSGSVEEIIADVSSETTYTVRVIVTDAVGYNVAISTLHGTAFTLDFLAGGKGAAFGKPAELENVLDIAFQTRFLGGITHPYLEPETDLNEMRTPNTYIGANVTTYNYSNLPSSLTSGTFSLEVTGMGESGQVKQKVTYCEKTTSRVWERFYYGTPADWGNWICVSDFDGQLLWSGAVWMTVVSTGSQTAALSEPVSRQRSGIVLAWSAYNVDTEAACDWDWHYQFIPKYHVNAHNGAGVTTGLMCSSGLEYVGKKYVYVYDDRIEGNYRNSETGTTNGVTFNSKYWVLRYIIGV